MEGNYKCSYLSENQAVKRIAKEKLAYYNASKHIPKKKRRFDLEVFDDDSKKDS